jgi:hypothetical protein
MNVPVLGAIWLDPVENPASLKVKVAQAPQHVFLK